MRKGHGERRAGGWGTKQERPADVRMYAHRRRLYAYLQRKHSVRNHGCAWDGAVEPEPELMMDGPNGATLP